jgi:hypothetical protein
MSVSYTGPMPKMTTPRRTGLSDRNTAHRNVTSCLFCSEELSRTDHCLRHVKAKHSLGEVDELPHWETVFNADPLHISARKVKRPDGDKIYDVGYCWDCHHWIPGRSMVQFQEHTCKMRKPYQRKTDVTPPPPVASIVPENDDEEEDDGEETKWAEIRDTLTSTLRRHTLKWPDADKHRVMAIAHKALGESDSMLACSDLVRMLADLTRSPVTPAATPPPPVAVKTPVPVAPPAPVVTQNKPYHARQTLAAPAGGRELR